MLVGSCSPLVVRSRGAVARLTAIAALATMGACIFPSFDGFQGNEPREAGTDDEGGDAARDGARGEASVGDAQTYACDNVGLRCKKDLEFCCGQLLAESICKTPPIGLIDCSEVLTCGDRADCSGSDVCCFDTISKQGRCMASCTAVEQRVVCDIAKTPTSCPSPQTCTGLWEQTVPFCQ